MNELTTRVRNIDKLVRDFSDHIRLSIAPLRATLLQPSPCSYLVTFNEHCRKLDQLLYPKSPKKLTPNMQNIGFYL